MTDAILQKFIKLIGNYTGLQIRPQDQEILRQKIESRMKILRIYTPEDYCRLLESNTQKSELEWRQLVILLTTTESYFFRDKGLFDLLQNSILPELIEKNLKLSTQNPAAAHELNYRSAGTLSSNSLGNREESKPTLRIWSAGCSTGEEPYSIAMLLKQLIPNWEQWNILVLGTDINEEVLTKAKQGLYSSWSFRLVDNEIRNRYFFPYQGGWKIDETIRNSVKFSYQNLARDLFPSFNSSIYEMDLIICRNVFVYFESASIARTVNKFYTTLKPGGYLVTGHAELHGQDLSQYQAILFPECVLYQKQDPAAEILTNSPTILPGFNLNVSHLLTPPTSPLNAETQHPLELTNFNQIKAQILSENHAVNINALTSNKHLNTTLAEAQNFFHNKAYLEAIHKAEQIINSHPKNFEAYYLLAEVYANLGQYNIAENYCHKALEIDQFSIASHYLLAHIAEEKGELEVAKIWLRRILYLAHDSIAAYLQLASIYEGEGNTLKAQKMLKVSLEMLKKMPPNKLVEHHHNLTVYDLILYLDEALKKYPDSV